MKFDPSAAAVADSGIFGLPNSFEDSAIVIVPMPFDATTSYGNGAHRGPGAVLEASKQVDLFDHHFGRVYEQGIFMDDAPKGMLAMCRKARKMAETIIAKGGATESALDKRIIKAVNAAGDRVNAEAYAFFRAALECGKTPALLGGDHSTPFGAIKACAEFASGLDAKGGLGILHFDAHMDLRDAFEGFAWSHASIMHNVLERVPQVSTLVQVGIRDYSEDEVAVATRHKDRTHVHYGPDLNHAALEGEKWSATCARILKPLPKNVYISFDIDALEPHLCPHTGTPVAGGLSFDHAALLLAALAKSGRNIVGFDLVEVCPGGSTEIDANIGARVLYKLCGAAGAV